MPRAKLPPPKATPEPMPPPAPPVRARQRRSSAELDAEVPPGSLQERVLTMMRARKMSAKALSRKAGLTEDTVRAIVRGRVASPRSRNLAQLAAALGLSVDQLIEGTGLVPEAVTGAAIASGDRREVDVPEVDLRAKGGVELPSDPRQVPRHRTWSLPTDLLDEQGVAVSDLVIVRVAGGEGVTATDRLLVDLAERRPSGGAYLIWADGRHAVERIAARYRGSMAPYPEYEVVGRVVGKWGWL